MGLNFYESVIMMDPAFASPSRVSAIHLLEPVTRAAVQKMMADLGDGWMVYETYRSKERQRELFKRGATKLQSVGVHHYGLAVDIVKRIGGEPSWKGSFADVGVVAEKYGLVWGGDWKSFRDMPHCQRIKVADQTRLFVGTFYPDAEYQAI